MAPSSDKKKRIVRRYVESLPDKVERLESLARALEEGRPSSPPRVRDFAHRLAGTGGSYGFPEISDAARLVTEAADGELSSTVKGLIEVLQTVAEETAATPTRVLLVEDDPDMCVLVTASIEGLADVVVAPDARDAARHLAKGAFDLLLLDLVLPDRDGRELLRDIRRDPSTAQLPVIVLTAFAGTAQRTECFRLGVEHFIAKPLDEELVRTAVAGALRRLRDTERKTRRDTLTGLHNRLGFQEEVRALANLASRTQTPLSVGILDIDHFKDVNDTHGHAFGDAVLRGLADDLVHVLRASDVSARWGGEEFTVALPNTSADEAQIALNKVLATFSGRRFTLGEATATDITFSAGVVEVGDDEPLEDALLEADRLLYAAKGAGRNQILNAIPSTGARPRVLVIEDDPDAARLARDVLEANDEREVEVAYTGREGLARATDAHFDLIVLDWRLPDISGQQVLEELRALRAYRRVPIVVLTALGDEATVERAFEAGADDYIQKPFRPRELGARVSRLFRRSLPPASLPPRRIATPD